MSASNWRESTVRQEPQQTKETRAGYTLRKIWIPDDNMNMLVGPDEWEPVRGIRFTGDDKAFFFGACGVLGLNGRQKMQLLNAYARKYKSALQAAKGRQGAEAMANREANTWLRKGAYGFLIRE